MADEIIIRRGTAADSYQTFLIFESAIADLMKRMGSSEQPRIADPEHAEKMWQQRKSLFEHLAAHATEFWVAARDERVLGYSRSILRENTLELTELMILPEAQSLGFGRELIERAFSNIEANHRSIIATPDWRAQKLYLKNGVYPRFAIYYFGREPQQVAYETDLEIVAIPADPETYAALGEIDKAIIGHCRDQEHEWLAVDRQGFLYYRSQNLVGYGYIGELNGPFALLDAADFPAVMAHAETQAALAGREHFGLEIPTINNIVMAHLLERGFEPGNFATIYMTDQPTGKFENYVFTAPIFFV
ncbi:MAG: GNAT family N-acetyltransferase [Anaerolineales bacterium]|nr:GNAT family N-acetyltransferase [Anaerolineales bacterium]